MNATQTQNKDLQLSINRVTGTLNLTWQADTSIRSNLTLDSFELNLPIVPSANSAPSGSATMTYSAKKKFDVQNLIAPDGKTVLGKATINSTFNGCISLSRDDKDSLQLVFDLSFQWSKYTIKLQFNHAYEPDTSLKQLESIIEEHVRDNKDTLFATILKEPLHFLNLAKTDDLTFSGVVLDALLQGYQLPLSSSLKLLKSTGYTSIRISQTINKVSLIGKFDLSDSIKYSGRIYFSGRNMLRKPVEVKSGLITCGVSLSSKSWADYVALTASYAGTVTVDIDTFTVKYSITATGNAGVRSFAFGDQFTWLPLDNTTESAALSGSGWVVSHSFSKVGKMDINLATHTLTLTNPDKSQLPKRIPDIDLHGLTLSNFTVTKGLSDRMKVSALIRFGRRELAGIGELLYYPRYKENPKRVNISKTGLDVTINSLRAKGDLHICYNEAFFKGFFYKNGKQIQKAQFPIENGKLSMTLAGELKSHEGTNNFIALVASYKATISIDIHDFSTSYTVDMKASAKAGSQEFSNSKTKTGTGWTCPQCDLGKAGKVSIDMADGTISHNGPAENQFSKDEMSAIGNKIKHGSVSTIKPKGGSKPKL